MKYIIPIIIALVVVACKTVEVTAYRYSSTTMMGSETVTITKDSVITTYASRGGGKEIARATTDEEWEALKVSAEELNVKELSKLEGPTNNRSTDASPYGTIYLITADSTYNSASFDGFNANEKLVPLMTVIKGIMQNR